MAYETAASATAMRAAVLAKTLTYDQALNQLEEKMADAIKLRDRNKKAAMAAKAQAAAAAAPAAVDEDEEDWDM